MTRIKVIIFQTETKCKLVNNISFFPYHLSANLLGPDFKKGPRDNLSLNHINSACCYCIKILGHILQSITDLRVNFIRQDFQESSAYSAESN